MWADGLEVIHSPVELQTNETNSGHWAAPLYPGLSGAPKSFQEAAERGDALDALCSEVPGAAGGRVRRTHQWLDAGGRREPLPAPPGVEEWTLAASAPAATAPAPTVLRAS